MDGAGIRPRCEDLHHDILETLTASYREIVREFDAVGSGMRAGRAWIRLVVRSMRDPRPYGDPPYVGRHRKRADSRW